MWLHYLKIRINCSSQGGGKSRNSLLVLKIFNYKTVMLLKKLKKKKTDIKHNFTILQT